MARILEAVLRDENRVLTVSSLLQGDHGIEDVCLSLCFVSRRGAGEPLPVRYDEAETAALCRSAGIVRETARRLGY